MTTPRAPEQGVIDGIRAVIEMPECGPEEVSIIHSEDGPTASKRAGSGGRLQDLFENPDDAVNVGGGDVLVEHGPHGAVVVG